MAYAKRERNRAVTLAAVGALHAGAIYALVVGLAGPAWEVIVPTPFVGEQIPLPEPSPKVIETAAPKTGPKADPARDRDSGRQIVEVNLDFGAEDEIVLPPFGGGFDEKAIDPPPPDPPAPTFAPKRAVPRGAPGSWVTPNDYPAADLRAGHSGVTRFQLTIGADGKVQACDIIASSGHATLDAAACAKLRQRAKFAAATDSSGAAVAGTYTNVVRWTIPKEY